jgi:hypothetical protein
MVGGENIFSPPPELVMLMPGLVLMRMGMRFERSGSVHFRRKLSLQYLERGVICKVRNFENPRRFPGGGS